MMARFRYYLALVSTFLVLLNTLSELDPSGKTFWFRACVSNRARDQNSDLSL